MKYKTSVLAILLVAGILTAVLTTACSLGNSNGDGDGGGLAAPTMVTAVGTSSTSITLTWTAMTGAVKYKIYTAVTSTGYYQFVDETVYNSHIVNDLVPSRTYYFKVSSVDISGIEGPQSTYATGTTFDQPIPIPASVTASPLSSNSIQVTWNSVTGASSYKIYRSAASSSYALVGTVSSTTSYIDTGLSALTTYYYRVSAVTSLGEGEQSTLAQATTPAEGVVPAPGGVQASSLSSDSIMLSWNAVSEAIGYKIYRSNSSAGSYTLRNSVGTTTSYTDNGLSPSTIYYYKVSTLHNNGESAQSSPVSASTSAEAPIQPPTGLNASALSSSSIQVTWSGVSGATGYRVYRSSSASGAYNLTGSAASSPYTDNGLSSGTTYYYKVSSVKDSQESVQSSTYASATTQTGGGTIDYPPTMPTGLVVSSVYSGSITLTWNSVPTATSYNVYRSNTQTGAEAKINTSPVTSASYTDSVPAGASYFYKVTGVNSSGESPRSSAAFAFAASHYALSNYSSVQTLSLAASGRHYYRLAVTQGASYTIEWQNGNNQNNGSWLAVSAYQNDGTAIFSNQYNGYTNPRVFTATATGFATVVIWNEYNDRIQNYQVYYY